MKYGQSYREQVTLKDGRVVTLRPVRPDDKALLVDGFEALSDKSRYQRFLAVKNRLSEPEVRYLTEIDGHDHFALGAVADGPDGTERGIGVARFVRFRGEPTVAEPAIAVTDDAQGLGLGGVLLQRLIEAASERGVTRFRAELLSGNKPIRHLLRKWCPDISFEVTDDGTATAEVELAPSVSPDQINKSLAYRILRRAALSDMTVENAPKLSAEKKAWLVPIIESEDISTSKRQSPAPPSEAERDEFSSFRRVIIAADVFEPVDSILQVPLHMNTEDCQLIMLYCLDRPALPKALPYPMHQRLDLDLSSKVTTKLGELAKPLLRSGFDVSARIVLDSPASGIVNASAELRADLVVIGTHDCKGVKRFLLGSVSEHVVRHCGCSVWVARPTDGLGRLRRILVPTDFSPSADLALQTAASLAHKGDRITLFNCWRLPDAAREPWADTETGAGDLTKSLRQIIVESAEAEGNLRTEAYADSDFEIVFEHTNANARDGILERLEQEQWDLVVMGSRGRRGLARWFLGSVADKVARRAPSSVLIVRS